jgi:hypothetical protein
MKPLVVLVGIEQTLDGSGAPTGSVMPLWVRPIPRM